MKKNLKKILFLLLIISVVAITIANVLKKTEVEVVKLKKGVFKKSFVEEGTVVSNKSLKVYSEISGKIEKKYIEEGQGIEKGDRIFKLDVSDLKYQLENLRGQYQSLIGEENQSYKDPYDSEIKSKELEIKRLSKKTEELKEDYEDNLVLRENGIISKNELETTKNALDEYENLLEQAKESLEFLKESSKQTEASKKYYEGRKKSLEAQIENLKNKIEDEYITSPIKGIVNKINVEEGTNINLQQPLVEIIGDNNLEIETFVNTSDAIELKVSDEVNLVQEVGTTEKTYKGKIIYISPTAEEKTSALGLKERKVKIKVLPNDNQEIIMRHGYNIDIEFITEHKKDVLLVPKLSVFDDQVIVIENDKMMLKNIEILSENDEYYTTDSLSENALIVYNPEKITYNENEEVVTNIVNY